MYIRLVQKKSISGSSVPDRIWIVGFKKTWLTSRNFKKVDCIHWSCTSTSSYVYGHCEGLFVVNWKWKVSHRGGCWVVVFFLPNILFSYCVNCNGRWDSWVICLSVTNWRKKCAGSNKSKHLDLDLDYFKSKWIAVIRK